MVQFLEDFTLTMLIYLNNVNKDLIKAKFDNGVLNVHLPKKEKSEKDTNKIVVE